MGPLQLTTVVAQTLASEKRFAKVTRAVPSGGR